MQALRFVSIVWRRSNPALQSLGLVQVFTVRAYLPIPWDLGEDRVRIQCHRAVSNLYVGDQYVRIGGKMSFKDALERGVGGPEQRRPRRGQRDALQHDRENRDSGDEGEFSLWEHCSPGCCR